MSKYEVTVRTEIGSVSSQFNLAIKAFAFIQHRDASESDLTIRNLETNERLDIGDLIACAAGEQAYKAHKNRDD